VLSLTGTDSKVKAFLTTLRKEILADQPIRQNIRNLAEFILAEGRIMNLFWES